MSHRRARPGWGIVLALAWGSAVAAGLYRVAAYESTPGPEGLAPAGWPAGTSVRRVAGVPNVVMAVHPRCPCTRASLATLGDVLRLAPAGSSIRLLAFRSAAGGPGRDDPPRPEVAGRPGVEWLPDPGGMEAARFGLATSGAAVAFDASGRLRFAGGLNAGRGLRESSEGAGALLAVLRGEGPRVGAARAYGCPVRAAGDGPASEGRP